MNLAQLKIEINRLCENYPDKAEEIQDLYQLCLDEIEQGESTPHEIELCLGGIDDLIKENE